MALRGDGGVRGWSARWSRRHARALALSKTETQAFLVIFSLAVLAASALLAADVHYSDDLIRVRTGETLWNANMRPLATLLVAALQLGTPLTDVSPLFQILTLGLYSLSAVYLSRLCGVSDLVFTVLCGLVFVLTPFNLGSFAYQFDSLIMGVAVLTSVVAALLVDTSARSSTRREGLAGIGLTATILFCTLSLYQPGVSVYLVACVWCALVRVLDRDVRPSVLGFAYTLIPLLAAAIAYLPLKSLLTLSDYTIQHATLAPMEALPQYLWRNWRAYWQTVGQLLGDGALFGLVSVLPLAVVVVVCFDFGKPRREPKADAERAGPRAGLAVLYLLLLLIAPIGFALLLELPVFAPRAMMGFSALVAGGCLFVSARALRNSSRLRRSVLAGYLGVVCLSFLNVALTFGNALHAADARDQVIATLIASDLEELQLPPHPSAENPGLAFVGDLGRTSHANFVAYEKYPLVRTLVWPILQGAQQYLYLKLEMLGFEYRRTDYGLCVFTGPGGRFVPQQGPLLTRPLYRIYLQEQSGNCPHDLMVVAFRAAVEP